MPRKSRIAAPGALHHIIARGSERLLKRVFPRFPSFLTIAGCEHIMKLKCVQEVIHKKKVWGNGYEFIIYPGR